MATLIKNGNLYQAGRIYQADVLIEDGKIKAIGKNLSDVVKENLVEIDATNKLVAPGLVDVHVHYRDPGFTYKETIHTGSLAAAHGGYTTVCAMPNLDPVPDTPELVEKMKSGELFIYECPKCGKKYRFCNGIRKVNMQFTDKVDENNQRELDENNQKKTQ